MILSRYPEGQVGPSAAAHAALREEVDEPAPGGGEQRVVYAVESAPHAISSMAVEIILSDAGPGT